MKTTTLFLLITLFCSVAACKKDDNNDPDCVKEENYFTAEFGGQTLEPIWSNISYGSSIYNFSIYRQPQNQNNWKLSVGTQNPDIYIYIYMKDIVGVGDYPIETGTEEDLPNMFSKTYIYIYNESYAGDPNSSIFTHFSLVDTGNINITNYDSAKGIVVGTFNCTMYSTHNEGETLPISGEFNINLQTHDKTVRPCWL